MTQISFAKRHCIVGKLNPRVEMHGDESKNACDIVLHGIPFNQEDLDKLVGPYTSRSLYTEEGRGNSKIIKPALPRFKSFDLGDTFYKSRATIAFNFHDNKIELKKIKIKDVSFQCHDGGTTILSVKLQGYPTEKELGWLYISQGKEQSVTLYFGPTVDEEAEARRGDADKQQGLALGEGGAKDEDDVERDDDGASGSREPSQPSLQ